MTRSTFPVVLLAGSDQPEGMKVTIRRLLDASGDHVRANPMRALRAAVADHPEWFEVDVIAKAEEALRGFEAGQLAYEKSTDANGNVRGPQPLMDSPMGWRQGPDGLEILTHAATFPEYSLGRTIYRLMTNEGRDSVRRALAAPDGQQKIYGFLAPSIGHNYNVTVLGENGGRQQVIGIRKGGLRHVALNEGHVVTDQSVEAALFRGIGKNEELNIGPQGDKREVRIAILGVGFTLNTKYGLDFGTYGRLDYDGTFENLQTQRAEAGDRDETEGLQLLPESAMDRELSHNPKVDRTPWQQLVAALVGASMGYTLRERDRSWATTYDLRNETKFVSPAEELGSKSAAHELALTFTAA